MLSGPHQQFCDAIVAGDNGTQAYRAAYPKSSAAAARSSAPVLLANPSIQAEIQRQRAKAEEKAGSSVLTLAERRAALAGIVRAEAAIFRGSTVHTADRIQAIKVDNDLAGEGSEAGANDALAGLLERVMK